MSMVRCDDCNKLIDSDYDPDCFEDIFDEEYPDNTKTTCRCTKCREY